MIRTGAVLLLGTMGAACLGQQMTSQPSPSKTVLYMAEEQSVKAGSHASVELRFKVLDGYHVNSHTPRSEFLIPTQLKIQPTAGVTAGSPEYSSGQEFTLSADPGEKLDVYTGIFSIRLPLVAAAGEHTMNAMLRYQACDRAACYPPKSLPVQIFVTAK